jgi:phosphatidate cytidylyltransferase
MSRPPAPPRASPSPGAGNLARRLATAAAGIPIVLALILAGGALYTATAAILLALAAAEIAHAAGVRRTDPLALWGMAAAAALTVAAHATPDMRLAALAALVAGSLVIALARAGVSPEDFRRWSAVVAGTAYVAVLGSHLVLLRRLPEGRDWVLLAVFTTFAVDTAAYASGRVIGGRKLAPRVSPGKTVAGAVGGLAGGAAAAAALNAALGLGQAPAAMLALGVAAAVAAEVGDLAESLLKRSLGVKDMGAVLPGHGGVLDRLDSLLFVAPVVYYLVRWMVL